MFSIKILSETTRPFVDKEIAEGWGPFIVTKGVLYDMRTHPGFIAVADGAVIGCVLYNLADGDCEITVLESFSEDRGIGKALITMNRYIPRGLPRRYYQYPVACGGVFHWRGASRYRRGEWPPCLARYNERQYLRNPVLSAYWV